MELHYALVCDSAFLSIDHKVNIIGVFETINAPAFPVTHTKFTLVGSVEPSKDRFKMVVDIVDQNTKKSILNSLQEREVILPTERLGKNFNFIVEVINTIFPQSGNYSVNLLIDGKIISEIPLQLIQVREGEKALN